MIHSQETSKAFVRKFFTSENLQLSYIDYGGESQNILLMLHGHMNDARTFHKIASKLTGWRMIGLDQRGHGWSQHPRDLDYSRESYVTDI